jgi:hypothetical protein
MFVPQFAISGPKLESSDCAFLQFRPRDSILDISASHNRGRFRLSLYLSAAEDQVAPQVLLYRFTACAPVNHYCLRYLKKLRTERFKSLEYQENEELKQRIIKETARRHAQSEKAIDGK